MSLGDVLGGSGHERRLGLVESLLQVKVSECLVGNRLLLTGTILRSLQGQFGIHVNDGLVLRVVERVVLNRGMHPKLFICLLRVWRGLVLEWFEFGALGLL